MNRTEEKYRNIALVNEMLETPAIIKNFNPDDSKKYAHELISKRGLFFTGEGSSRIFPAKRAIHFVFQNGLSLFASTEGSTQAFEYDLSNFGVFGSSNSGQTKELIRLFIHLQNKRHKCYFGLTSNNDSRLEKLAISTHILQCGKENAVAETKSVIEQALFYDSLVRNMLNMKMEGLEQLSDQVEEALNMSIDKEIIDRLKAAGLIYFAGRNNGVAEELALKTNEIARKKSDFLEGTYAVHGIEEVMCESEALVIIDPFKEEEIKFRECLEDGVKMFLIAISDTNTNFPTIKIPGSKDYKEYIELAAGWNLLVELGISLDIDLDHPKRARKVGNEFAS